MMKVIKKWCKGIIVTLASAALSFSAVVGYASAISKTEAPTARAEAVTEPLSVNSVMSKTSTDGKGLVMAVDHYGARYLQKTPVSAGEAGTTTDKYAINNVIKLHIGDRDFTDVNTWEIDVYSHFYTLANFWLVDSAGVTMRCNPAISGVVKSVTNIRTGESIDGGSDWAGVKIPKNCVKEGSNIVDESVEATIAYDKAVVETNNQVNAWNDKGNGYVSTVNYGTEFNWKSVRYILVLVRADRSSATTFGPSFFDIMDIRTTTGETKTSVFSAKDCIQKETLADVTNQNDFAIGVPEYNTEGIVLLSAEARKVTPGDFQTYKYGSSTDSTVWNLFFAEGKTSTSETVDLSAYNALSFEIDTTQVTNPAGVHLDWKMRDGNGTNHDRMSTGTNYYLMDTANESYGYYLEDGNASWFKPGLKARVVIPFTRFDGVTTDKLVNMSARLNLIAYMDNEAFNLSNIEYIADYESVIASYAKLDELDDAIAAFVSDFKAIEGASVRLADPAGIRFGAIASATIYNELIKQFDLNNVTYEFGTIIVPVDYVGKVEIVPRAENLLTIVRTEAGMKLNDTIMEYYGAMVNIHEYNYNRKFTGYSYLQYTINGETHTIYANKDEDSTVGYDRSIYEVAKSAIADGVENAYLQGIINTVEGEQ